VFQTSIQMPEACGQWNTAKQLYLKTDTLLNSEMPSALKLSDATKYYYSYPVIFFLYIFTVIFNVLCTSHTKKKTLIN
jgi:hypothetical protein